MSMFFDYENNIIRIDVPNSEANIDSQHCGIKDRTVGSYYMSENYEECAKFLDNFNGEYFIDLTISIRNANIILNELKDKNYQNAFKGKLIAQFKTLEALEWLINTEGYFHRMKAPFINDNQKYLKLDNDDIVVSSFKSLVLGDLVSIVIKKIGKDGFIFYLEKSPNYESILKNNTILKWMK